MSALPHTRKSRLFLDLTGENIGVRALGGKNQMDTKGPAQACKGGEPVFDLGQLLLSSLLRPVLSSSSATSSQANTSRGSLFSVVSLYASILGEPNSLSFFSVFQYRHKLTQGVEQIFLGEAHPAFLVPDFGKVHAALEIGYVDLRPLAECLHKQELEQNAFCRCR